MACNCKELKSYQNQKRIALIHQAYEKKTVYIYCLLDSYNYCFSTDFIPNNAKLIDTIEYEET